MLVVFAKAALVAGRDVELTVKAAENAVVVLSLVLKVTTADPPWSPADGLPLYQYRSRGLLSFSGLLCQNAGFAD